MVELIINGEKVSLDVRTLDEVVKHFGLEQNLVVTEVDGEIIDRSEWENKSIKPGMKIELVHFVGGG